MFNIFLPYLFGRVQLCVLRVIAVLCTGLANACGLAQERLVAGLAGE